VFSHTTKKRVILSHNREEKNKKEQTEKIQLQTSKEQTAGIRHTCFVQAEQILKIAVDHQYSPCRNNFHRSSS